MSKSNSPMNSDLMHETAMSEHVIQRVSKSPCIYVVHRYQGCTKGQKSGGAGSNVARGGVPPPPGGAF